MVTAEQITESLQQVYDPELSLDVITLGLIYDVKIEKKKVTITMTLTSPMCPYGPALMDDIRRAAAAVDGVGEVEINLTFSPPWTMERISEEGKISLGI